jgi:uncharacterized membrane protein YkoI
MSTGKKQRSVTRLMAAGAVVVGLAAGSYGIASAATGSTGTTDSSGNAAQSDRSAPSAQHPWGGQRSDETPLTGATLTKVRQAALAKVDNGRIERVETDADGHAAYEAHVIKQDGTPVTVYVDKQFNVVGVETR